MKKLFYILLMLLFAKNGFSQVVDTCFVNEKSTYRVINQQQNSLLFWEIYGGEIISENPTQSDSIVVLWIEQGIQTISIYEQTLNNCIGELANIEIRVTENTQNNEEQSIPNAITPNNDGKNDKWRILGYSECKVLIYNRWGNLVFYSDNYQNNWDGANEISGAYYYVITTKNGNSFKGVLNLIK